MTQQRGMLAQVSLVSLASDATGCAMRAPTRTSRTSQARDARSQDAGAGEHALQPPVARHGRRVVAAADELAVHKDAGH